MPVVLPTARFTASVFLFPANLLHKRSRTYKNRNSFKFKFCGCYFSRQIKAIFAGGQGGMQIK